MEIHNIQEYIDIIENLREKYTYEVNHFCKDVIKPHFLYRGHSDHEKYKLEPQIMRMKQTQYGQITKFSQLEYNILCDFICEARSFETNIRDDDIQGY